MHPDRPRASIRSAGATDPGDTGAMCAAQVRVVYPATPEALAGHGVLAIVCDGSAVHPTAALAAQLAVETVVRGYAEAVVHKQPHKALPHAVQSANRLVYAMARRFTSGVMIGTSCTALVLYGGGAYCAHVGDSRVYLLRHGELYLMTEDHSAAMQRVREGTLSVSESRWHQDRRVLARVLGKACEVEVADWPAAFALYPGDRFLLCTRSVHDALSESALRQGVGVPLPRDGCAALIEAARASGAQHPLAVAIVAH